MWKRKTFPQLPQPFTELALSKSRHLPEEGIRRHQQDQPERDNFIPDDAAVVRVANRPAGHIDGPDTENISASEERQQLKVAGRRTEEREGDPGEEGAESAGSPTRQTTATTAGNEMRRMRQ